MTNGKKAEITVRVRSFPLSEGMYPDSIVCINRIFPHARRISRLCRKVRVILIFRTFHLICCKVIIIPAAIDNTIPDPPETIIAAKLLCLYRLFLYLRAPFIPKTNPTNGSRKKKTMRGCQYRAFPGGGIWDIY